MNHNESYTQETTERNPSITSPTTRCGERPWPSHNLEQTVTVIHFESIPHRNSPFPAQHLLSSRLYKYQRYLW
jgi:hypothetical protein